MIIDRFQHHLAEPIILNQMAELADRRVVWRRLIAKINVDEIPHHGAVIKAIMGLRVRHVEPLLQEVDAQHPFDPNRRAAAFA